MSSMNLTRALRFLLALALLAVWQGALVHPLLHVDAKSAFVHVPGSHAPKGPSDKNGSNPLCDAIAAVTACVGGALALSIGAVVQLDPLTELPSWQARLAPRLPYRSQAPPSLL